MSEINVFTNIYPNIGCHIGAAEECKIALNQNGINYVSIKPQRGAHNAEIYIGNEYIEKFESEILGNTLIGTYRKFFFSKISKEIGENKSTFYYVSYLSK